MSSLPLYVCVCVTDMVCAAHFSSDHQFYRAQVLSLPGGRLAEVLYVDFGNKETMPHWELRKLKDQFLRLPVQVDI